MKKEELVCDVFSDPFPHMIVRNYYNDDELKLLWQELDFYTHPGKLLNAENFGGIVGKTNSSAVILDQVYRDYSDISDGYINGQPNFRSLSSILTLNRKLFESGVLDALAKAHGCMSIINKTNWDTVKVRYYHNGEYYKSHTDKSMPFLAFYYAHKEPKKYTGGEVFFPEYDYEYACDNNSIIVFPGWVEHGVKEVTIENSDYYDGYGRYCISTFFGCKPQSDNENIKL